MSTIDFNLFYGIHINLFLMIDGNIFEYFNSKRALNTYSFSFYVIIIENSNNQNRKNAS